VRTLLVLFNWLAASTHVGFKHTSHGCTHMSKDQNVLAFAKLFERCLERLWHGPAAFQKVCGAELIGCTLSLVRIAELWRDRFTPANPMGWCFSLRFRVCDRIEEPVGNHAFDACNACLAVRSLGRISGII
jgi:hypothetical protein